VFVAKASFISFSRDFDFDTLSSCEGCLICCSERKPHPHITASLRLRQPWWSYSFRLTSY